MEKTEEILTIKTKTVKTDKVSFKTYKANVNGRSVDLRFTKASNKNAIAKLEENIDGYYKVVVSDVSESKTSFYPRMYATLLEIFVDNEPQF